MLVASNKQLELTKSCHMLFIIWIGVYENNSALVPTFRYAPCFYALVLWDIVNR